MYNLYQSYHRFHVFVTVPKLKFFSLSFSHSRSYILLLDTSPSPPFLSPSDIVSSSITIFTLLFAIPFSICFYQTTETSVSILDFFLCLIFSRNHRYQVFVNLFNWFFLNKIIEHLLCGWIFYLFYFFVKRKGIHLFLQMIINSTKNGIRSKNIIKNIGLISQWGHYLSYVNNAKIYRRCIKSLPVVW